MVGRKIFTGEGALLAGENGRGSWRDCHPALQSVFPEMYCHLKEGRTSSMMQAGARMQGAGTD